MDIIVIVGIMVLSQVVDTLMLGTLLDEIIDAIELTTIEELSSVGRYDSLTGIVVFDSLNDGALSSKVEMTGSV